MRTVALGAAALCLALVSGCGSDAATPEFDQQPEVSTQAIPPDDGAIDRIGEQVIRTASITMEVNDVAAAVSEASELTEEFDGFVQNESLQGIDEDATATMTIRVPADNLDALLESVGSLGEVRSSSVDSQDVTVEVIDIQARITAVEESISRLRVLQQQASSVTDLVAIESELTARQSELESLTAQRDYLSRQVAMSTVYVYLEQRDVGPGTSPNFLGGLQSGWNALLSLAGGSITVLGFLAPFLILAGVITVVVLAIVATVRRRRKEKA